MSKIPSGWEYNPYSSPEERLCADCGAKFEIQYDDAEDEGYCPNHRYYCSHCEGRMDGDIEIMEQGGNFCSEKCHLLHREDME